MSIQTHKEVNGYAENYNHTWSIASVPRNPSFYQPVPAPRVKGYSHFLDSMRKLPGDKQERSRIVRLTIEDGDVYEAEADNRYRFLWMDPRTLNSYSLIVELRAEAFAYESEKHYAITVYRIET